MPALKRSTSLQLLAAALPPGNQLGAWLDRLEARLPRNVVIVAMANKLARIAWAVLTKGQSYSTAAYTYGRDGNRAAIPTFPYDGGYEFSAGLGGAGSSVDDSFDLGRLSDGRGIG